MQSDTFIFLDTCYSGLPGKDSTLSSTDRFISELATVKKLDAVRFIMSSSQGSQTSQELFEYGHGAFTYALLEAMREGKGLNPNQSATPASLFNWVSFRVPELTNNQQNPNFNGGGGSLPIWRP
ncbi:MAG: caspase family protein [Deinococcales bacterium]